MNSAPCSSLLFQTAAKSQIHVQKRWKAIFGPYANSPVNILALLFKSTTISFQHLLQPSSFQIDFDAIQN